MENLIGQINDAIRDCKEANGKAENSKAFVQNKNLLVEAVREPIAQLKAMYNKGFDDQLILETCENAAKEVMECGNHYFKLNNNATVFLESNFTVDADTILRGLPLSASINDFFRNVYERWHWHGW